MRKEYTINGNNFSTIKGFYDEIEAVFTLNLNWKIGRNLDALNDVLRGGFGRHEYGEPILIKWVNFRKSERNLGSQSVNDIVGIILDSGNSGHDCILEKL